MEKPKQMNKRLKGETFTVKPALTPEFLIYMFLEKDDRTKNRSTFQPLLNESG